MMIIVKDREKEQKQHGVWLRIRDLTTHQFHLVDSSQIPIITAISAMLLVLSIIFRWYPNPGLWDGWILPHVACSIFPLTLLSWFISIVRESNAGHHTSIVQQGLRLGMILFIVSEILFFFAFFWAFFHFSLAPSIFIGCVWPPKGTQPIDPWGLPLVNTLLLLSSGITITFAHHALLQSILPSSRDNFLKCLFSTIILGITFLLCQAIEYKYGITFSWKDNIYGSIFFVTTGFHGFHVTIGTLFLWFCLVRESLDKLIRGKNSGIFFSIAYFLYRSTIYKKLDSIEYYKSRNQSHFIVTKEHGPKVTESVLPGYIVLLLNKDMCGNILEYFNINALWKSYYYAQKELIIAPMIEDELRKDTSLPNQHLGFEAAAWYWHFVDVVWLFLFVTIYWWGGS